MKLFGEFLVEKKIIDENALVDALVEQVKAMPSYAELAWKNQLIAPKDLLQVMKTQYEKRVGFLEALRELSLWNQDLEKKLLESAGGTRTPLGQILVSRGVMTVEEVTHALDEYLGSMKNALKATPAKPKPQPKVEEAPSEPLPPVAEGENSLMEAMGSDLKGLLIDLTEKFVAGEGVGKKDLKDFFDGIHRLRGAARFTEAAEIEKICEGFETALTPLLKMKTPKADVIKSVARTARALTDFLWKLYPELEQGHTVAQALEGKELHELKEQVSGLIEVLKFDTELASL